MDQKCRSEILPDGTFFFMWAMWNDIMFKDQASDRLTIRNHSEIEGGHMKSKISKKDIETALQQLKQQRKKLQILAIILLGMIAIDGILLVSISGKAGAVGAVITALYYILIVRKKHKEYRKAYIRQTILCGTAAGCEDVIYDENKDQMQYINASSLFPLKGVNGVSLFQGFRCSWKNMQVLVNESAIQMEPAEKKKGAYSNVRMISGTTITICGEKAKLPVEVLAYQHNIPTNRLNDALIQKGYAMADKEAYDLGTDQMFFYTPEKQEATEELKTMMRKVEKMACDIERPFAIAYEENRIVCTIGGVFYAPDVAGRDVIGEGNLTRNRLPDMERILKFAEEYLG